MSSLYNSDYVNSIREDYLLDIFQGRKYVDLNPNNLENKHLYIVLEHYLIKYIETHKKDEHAKRWLEKFYNDFIDYPYLFCDSPLIKDEFIERFSQSSQRSRIKEYRNKYYDSRKAESLYLKLLKNNLRDDEKNRLYSYLISQFNINNTRLDSIYKLCCKSILDSNRKIKNLNDMELKFYAMYVSKIVSQGLVKPEIHINTNCDNKIDGYQNNYLIFLNKNSKNNTIVDFTQTICREVRYSIQKRESTNKVSRIGFEYITKELFSKYLDSDIYKEYYPKEVEFDAEKHSYFQSKAVLELLERNDLTKKIIDKKDDIIGVKGSLKSDIKKDRFIVSNLDSIIRSNPNELSRYRLLNNIYNSDGSRKEFIDLLKFRLKHGINDNTIFDNYISCGIDEGELEKIDVSELDDGLRNSIYKFLSILYPDKAVLFKDNKNNGVHKM